MKLKRQQRALEMLEIQVRALWGAPPSAIAPFCLRAAARFSPHHTHRAPPPPTTAAPNNPQEAYLKDEMKNLKRELVRAQEDLKKIRAVPLSIGSFSEMIDDSHAIINSTSGSTYYVRVMSTIDRELLKANATLALNRHSQAVVDVLPSDADSTIQAMQMSEKPDVSYDDIGGMDMQKQEMREAVELPLQMPELYAQIGIDPPRGVLMYGPPGTGKTMMAKAVANATTAAFIRVVGSEFVQKYLGEGPRMVRDVFRLARESAPAIIFIGAFGQRARGGGGGGGALPHPFAPARTAQIP